MSKTILKNQQVVNMVVSILVGKHAINNYAAQNGEWLDGKRSGALLIPTTTISESLPPVLIEIQSVVDKAYVHRLNKYCNHIYDEYSNMEPIALTICSENTRMEICNMFSNSPKASYLKQLPSHFWAKEHLIMIPTIITDYIDDHSNDNNTSNNTDRETNNDSTNDNNENNTDINNKPLPPLVALGYVLMEQRCSLFGLQYKEDPTVMLLYQIAKEALDHQIQDHQSTVDRLLNVATETQKQFKRIIEVANEDEPNLKRVRSLASAGVLYTETCLHKYQWQYPDDSDMMPMPLDLPSSVQLPKSRLHVDILPSLPSGAQLEDMEYARAFKDEYLKTHKQMN